MWSCLQNIPARFAHYTEWKASCLCNKTFRDMKLRIEADAIHTISAAGEPQAVLLRCLYAAHLCFHSNIIRLICNHYMPVSHKISSLHRAATAPMNKCIKKHTRGFMTDDYSYMTTFFQGHYKKTKKKT